MGTAHCCRTIARRLRFVELHRGRVATTEGQMNAAGRLGWGVAEDETSSLGVLTMRIFEGDLEEVLIKKMGVTHASMKSSKQN